MNTILDLITIIPNIEMLFVNDFDYNNRVIRVMLFVRY